MPLTLQAALLGIVQGVTEFLPVSSTAHLIIARAFFGFDGDKFGLTFDVACHVGTLIAVLVCFRKSIAEMTASLPHLFDPADRGARLIWLLVVGTVPAVIVGLLFNKVIEAQWRTPPIAAAALAVGAVGLLVAERAGSKTRSDEGVTISEAFWIGCAQATALIPGVSPSRATLTLPLPFRLR